MCQGKYKTRNKKHMVKHIRMCRWIFKADYILLTKKSIKINGKE